MRQYLRIVIALVGLAGFGVAAKAQVADQLVVTIPFEFTVAGKTLPAGTYRVNRVSTTDNRTLMLSSYENRASVMVIPTYVEEASGDKTQITFEQVGDQHFLNRIATADHVFAFPVSREAVLLASTKSHGGTPSGSSNGSN
jgi:hypothetical protein